MEELAAQSVWFWLVIASILITQSTWLFIDARKRSSLHWFWGIWGLIQFPMPLVFYFVFVRSGWFSRRDGEEKNNDGDDG